nr:N-6 DNA methylase [Pedobacter sp. ASV2]
MAFELDRDLQQQLWKATDLLRGTLAADEYHVVLFLLSLQRERLLNDLDGYDPFERRFKLEELIEGDLLAHNELFEEIYDKVYKPIIQNIPVDAFNRITDLILRIDLRYSFSRIFDSFLSHFIELSGKGGSFYQTPNQIADFAFSLVDVPLDANIYNPFAGLSSFGILQKENQNYFGQEIDMKAWAIGLLRLYAYDVLPNGTFSNDSSIQNWYPRFDGDFSSLEKLLKTGAPRKKDIDLLISSPPFGYKALDTEYLFGKKYNAETLVLEQGLEILSNKGKIVCLVSNGRLFSGGHEKDLRQHLIQNDYLEMVISFPGALLQNTSIPFSIIVINKDKRSKGKVKFIDTASFITREKKKWDFNYQQLLSDIHADIKNDAIRLVSNGRVEKEEYNFNVGRYFINNDPESVSIGELGEILTTNTPLKHVGHLITTQWLRAEPLDYLIPNNFVPYEQLTKTCRQLTESCFVISTLGGRLKFGYFKYEGIPFYISQDIFPFRLTSNTIDPEYFVLQISSQDIQDQVRAYSSGSSMLRLSKKDFLNLAILIPQLNTVRDSLQHQQFIVRSTRTAYLNAQDNERQYFKYKEEAARDFHSMKHTFRQYLSSLKSNTLGTKKFLELNEGKQISLDMIYSNNLRQNLGTHLQNVDALIIALSNLLEDAPEKGTEETIDVVEFVSHFQNEFTFGNKFSYMLIIDDVSFQDEEMQDLKPKISIDKLQFKKVLSNIVSNAVEHGFLGNDEYIIAFTVMVENKSLILEVTNNGKPMPTGFGLKELITRGEKTVDSKGTGLGGYDIKTIVEIYGGSLNLENNPEDEFPVIYRLKFPLISE